jgi:hypothetical protein
LDDASIASSALAANVEHSVSLEPLLADGAVSRMNSFRWCSVIFLAGAVLGSLMWMVAAGMFGREIAFVQLSTYGYINFRRG